MTSDHPPRRWYQFRLSTILVLVGIAAWAMAYGPSISYEYSVKGLRIDSRSVSLTLSLDRDPTDPYSSDGNGRDNLCFDSHAVWRGNLRRFWLVVTPKRIAWPLLALAAFLTWKLGWAIVARRKRQREGTA